MDNIGIVVESLEYAIDFFTELGLTLEGLAFDRRGVGSLCYRPRQPAC